jgi:V/A-type H+-transporting ATPase subunit I
MGLKPQPARWFEALAARDDLSRLAEVLARTGVVQVESEQETGELRQSPELRAKLDEYDRLARRYHPYWPSDESRVLGMPGAPAEVVGRALEHVRAWSQEADPVIARLERIESEHSSLSMLHELLSASGDDFPDFDKLRHAGPSLTTRLYVLPRQDARRLELGEGRLMRRIEGEQHTFALLVDSNDAASELEQSLLAAKARPVELPSWLASSPAASLALVASRLDELDAEEAAARSELVESQEAHDLAAALADLHRLRWFLANVPQLPETRNFAVVTGWTSDLGGATLRRALEESRLDALIHYPPAPRDRTPPIVLSNPRWVKPFEAFAGMLGTPAQHETDPSPLLAVIAPLLFGFMFGDVGQGFVLLVAGLLLYKRLPVLRLLIPGGIAAMGFGVLFGGVFGLHDVIPALWVHPLSDPLGVLVASLLGGAAILLLGLLLGGVQARWQHRLLAWLATDAALVAIYLGLLGVVLDRRALWVALGGVVWHVTGSGAVARRARLLTAASAGGHLIERTLQLFVNTVSFARVGAFALAHAGLSTAIVGLSHAAAGPAGTVAVLIVGNAFTLLLEGLVVSIQTTRLVLFEFFVRFLKGEGRQFRPLLPPPRPRPPATEGAHQT